MNERNELKPLYGAVVFGVIAAVAVFLFFSLSHREDKTESSKAEETKASYTEKTETEDTEGTKTEDSGAAKTANAEQAETAKEVFSEEDGAEDDMAGDGVMQRLRNVDWENVEPKKLEDIDDFPVKEILILDEIPKAEIRMYGYNDEEYHNEGVAIFMGDRPYYFDWYYTSPRFVMPRIYWNQADGQLQVSLHNFTGTSLAAEELHILRQNEDGELEDFFCAYDDYQFMLKERLSFSYDGETGQFTLYDQRGNRELCTLDLSWMEEDEQLMEQADPEKPLVYALGVGDIASFELGDKISLRVTPGYMVNCWATPQYDEMPELEAEICMEETEEGISFPIGDIKKAN